MKKYLALFLALAMLAALCVGCAQSGTSDPSTPAGDSSAPANDDVTAEGGKLQIGGIGPLTGGAAVYGIATKQGAQIAVDEINALGGLQLELNFQDDEADAEKGVNAYNNLKDWGMDILYGCTTTGSCIAVAAETNADRFFQLTPSASSTDVTNGKDNVFQLCFTDPNQGITAAQIIQEKGLGTKVAAIYNNADAYSTGIFTAFEAECKNIGLEIVSVGTFADDSNPDFSVQLTEAQNAGADLVFLPIYYTPASVILTQANQMGYAPAFFGCDGMDGILSMEGFDTTLAEDVILMTPFNAWSEDERVSSFVAKYQDAYGEVPNQFAADGYDCIYAIYEACTAAGITADTPHDEACETLSAMFADGSFTTNGLTGANMTWDNTGAVSKAPVVVRIVGGIYKDI